MPGSSFRDWLGTPPCLIYINYVLGAWGDWMWQFAVGLYLVHLAGGFLRLAAIFGFSAGTAVLLLGGIIGNWVDRTGRLKVIQIALSLQNLMVALCAVAVGIVLYYEEQVRTLWDGYLGYLCEAVIIILAVLAQLASTAYKIAIEKDWIVVISGGNKSRLANLNARTRAIDLTCKIVAPAAAGLVMTYGSLLIAAVVIAGWNIFSLVVEYALLIRVYGMVPRLAVKRDPDEETDEELHDVMSQDGGQGQPEVNIKISPPDPEALLTAEETTQVPEGLENTNKQDTCMQLMLEPFIVLAKGWKTYARQRVVFAGVSLACLYMTVLGFDSITTGYIYTQEVSEFMVGLSMALAGFTGIIGTFAFTHLRRRIGLERTGLIAYNAEIICLSLTVASVWAPGSPFDPFFLSRSTNCTQASGAVTSTVVPGLGTSEAFQELKPAGDEQKEEQIGCDEYQYTFEGTNISIILFLLGIITSRVGLWMADLVVTQLLQETVKEQERGMVNGVQNSINMLMDMIKFALVIFVPHIQTFGILIVVSFLFICIAGCFFAFHAWRERGHLFHFGKVKNLLCKTSCKASTAKSVGTGQGADPVEQSKEAQTGRSGSTSERSEDEKCKGDEGFEKGDRDEQGTRKGGEVSKGKQDGT